MSDLYGPVIMGSPLIKEFRFHPGTILFAENGDAYLCNETGVIHGTDGTKVITRIMTNVVFNMDTKEYEITFENGEKIKARVQIFTSDNEEEENELWNE